MKLIGRLFAVVTISTLLATAGCQSDHTSSNPKYDQNDVTDTADKANPPAQNGPVANPTIGTSDKQQ